MFNTLKKLFLSKIIFRKSMSTHTRHFANPKSDYQVEFGKPELPLVEIQGSLEEIIQKIKSRVKPLEENAGDGLYLGTAGIAYMFYHLNKIPTFSNKKNDYLAMALEYTKPSISVASCISNRKKDVPSFILGNCGIYAVAAAVFKAVGDEAQCDQFRKLYYEAANTCKDPNFLNCGSDELFVGRAGYILGALWLAKETKTPIQKQDIHDLCKITTKSGRDYSIRHNSPCPLMYAYYQVEYLGAAHGLCSILQVLLSVPEYLDSNPSDAVDIKRCIDFLLSIQTEEGNFPTATDEIGYRSELIHWCHGAGGMVYLMAKAYLVYNEEKYLNSCIKMADLIWHKGLLKKGPGLCHGVAGNGYVFLLLYRLTSDDKYLYRAIEFFRFMSSNQFKEARTPDYPFSLYEGLAGTACFLVDLTSPMQATFPFSDVF